MGIEPTTTSLPRRCSTTEPPRHTQSITLKSGRRESNPRGQLGRLEHYHCATPAIKEIWGRMDLNHCRAKARQIYSLLPLAARPHPLFSKERKKTLSLTESANIVYKNIKKVNTNIYDVFYRNRKNNSRLFFK